MTVLEQSSARYGASGTGGLYLLRVAGVLTALFCMVLLAAGCSKKAPAQEAYFGETVLMEESAIVKKYVKDRRGKKRSWISSRRPKPSCGNSRKTFSQNRDAFMPCWQITTPQRQTSGVPIPSSILPGARCWLTCSPIKQRSKS